MGCKLLYSAPKGHPESFHFKGQLVQSGKEVDVSDEIAGFLVRDFEGVKLLKGKPVSPGIPLSPVARRDMQRAMESGKVQVVQADPPAPLSEQAVRLFMGDQPNLIAAIKNGDLKFEHDALRLACHLLGRKDIVAMLTEAG